MNPIYNITDTWTRINISIRQDSVNPKNWWINFYCEKKNIIKDYPDPFKDLEIYY